MFNVAIVEDEKEPVERLLSCFEKYKKEFDVVFKPTVYEDAEKFLSDYKSQYDIVFMDIEMPQINGITASHRLRELDGDVALVFITRISRYAIEGYSVRALDYILKPLTYSAFSLKIKKVVNYCNKKTNKKFVQLNKAGTKIRVEINDILYVEISAHNATYHTLKGEIEVIGTLKEIQQMLDGCSFALCNRCYLVNLAHVRSIIGYNTKVGNEELQVSHSKKREFTQAFLNYCKA